MQVFTIFQWKQVLAFWKEVPENPYIQESHKSVYLKV